MSGNAALRATMLPTPEDPALLATLRPIGPAPVPSDLFASSGFRSTPETPSCRATTRPSAEVMTVRPRRFEEAPMTMRSGEVVGASVSTRNQPVRGAVRLLRFDLEFLQSMLREDTSPLAIKTLETILSELDRIEKQVGALERKQSNLTPLEGLQTTRCQR